MSCVGLGQSGFVEPRTSPLQITGESQVNKTIFMFLFLAAITLVSPREDDMALAGSTYINAVDLDIVPSERDKFLEAIAEDAGATIKEPGCLQFDVLVLASDPNHFFLYEVYESEAAFRAPSGNRSLQDICSNDRQHGCKARNAADDGDLVRAEASLGVGPTPVVRSQPARNRRGVAGLDLRGGNTNEAVDRAEQVMLSLF